MFMNDILKRLNSMRRPDLDEYFGVMAEVVSSRGTCPRRRVGCVLVSDDNKVLATGYNGVPSGFAHCIDEPCEGAKYRSGLGLDKCEAIHAEQNALLQTSDVKIIATAYCTTAPCIHCLKLLLNTGCQRIVFNQDYPHSEASKALWEKAGRIWHHNELEV
jgi:dCMP deaminase